VPDTQRKLRIDEAWICIDAGTVVNQDRAHAQMHSSVIMGIVEQSNFRDARIARIGDSWPAAIGISRSSHLIARPRHRDNKAAVLAGGSQGESGARRSAHSHRCRQKDDPGADRARVAARAEAVDRADPGHDQAASHDEAFHSIIDKETSCIADMRPGATRL
jgi:hypothetical protein